MLAVLAIAGRHVLSDRIPVKKIDIDKNRKKKRHTSRPPKSCGTPDSGVLFK